MSYHTYRRPLNPPVAKVAVYEAEYPSETQFVQIASAIVFSVLVTALMMSIAS
ncbi:MAG: hypothetical protein MUC48_15540 [Leptolyngbya sp. Prado105]|jgi:hypothetical protein|nr:hypothetical protein [Leptolyngbya sp. Prado105]